MPYVVHVYFNYSPGQQLLLHHHSHGCVTAFLIRLAFHVALMLLLSPHSSHCVGAAGGVLLSMLTLCSTPVKSHVCNMSLLICCTSLLFVCACPCPQQQNCQSILGQQIFAPLVTAVAVQAESPRCPLMLPLPPPPPPLFGERGARRGPAAPP